MIRLEDIQVDAWLQNHDLLPEDRKHIFASPDKIRVPLSLDKKTILTTSSSSAPPASTILHLQTRVDSDSYVGLDIHTSDIPLKHIQPIVTSPSWQAKLIPAQMLCNSNKGRQEDDEK